MQHRQNNHRISPGNSSDSKPGVHTITLNSGLTLRTVGRTAFEVSQTKVQISKGIGRGQTPYERLKTRQHVVHALEPLLAMSGITKVNNMSELDNYDIANDVLLTEHSLLAINKFAQSFDMVSIFIIPNVFKITVPASPHHATQMSNLLTEWKTADKDTVLRWQEFLLMNGSAEELESNNWMEETLYLSMDANLKAAVISDMQDLPARQRGAITVFYFAICRVAVRTQEALDLMIDWVKTFDLRNFANQNVSKASLSFKAVVRAIGERDLPNNAVNYLLRGMATSTNTSFQQLCMTTEAMLSIPSYRRQLGPISTMELTFSVIRDLEDRYLELLCGKVWEGIGHDESDFKTGGEATRTYVDTCPKNEGVKHSSLFSDWANTKKCHHCGGIGHIRPICPVLLRSRHVSSSSTTQFALNVSNGISGPKPSGKRRSEREALCQQRHALCQDTFYNSFVEIASNAKNIERSTFHRRFVRSFVAAFKLAFGKTAKANYQQVYHFRHHFPTAVAEVITFMGSSSVRIIESMIGCYKEMYLSAYESIFDEECTDRNSDVASSLNSKFRQLYGQAFAEDEYLCQHFEKDNASPSKQKSSCASTVYKSTSLAHREALTTEVGVCLAVYHAMPTFTIPTDDESTGDGVHQVFNVATEISDTSSIVSDYESSNAPVLIRVMPFSITASPASSDIENQALVLESSSSLDLEMEPASIGVPSSVQQLDASTCTFNEQSSMLMEPTSTSQEASSINKAASKKLVSSSTSELVELETFSSTTPESISTTAQCDEGSAKLDRTVTPALFPVKLVEVPALKSEVPCLAPVVEAPSTSTPQLASVSLPQPGYYVLSLKPWAASSVHLLSSEDIAVTEYDFVTSTRLTPWDKRPPPWPDPAEWRLSVSSLNHRLGQHTGWSKRHPPWPDPVWLIISVIFHLGQELGLLHGPTPPIGRHCFYFL